MYYIYKLIYILACTVFIPYTDIGFTILTCKIINLKHLCSNTSNICDRFDHLESSVHKYIIYNYYSPVTFYLLNSKNIFLF